MNKRFENKVDYILKRYPKADEGHLYRMLGKLIQSNEVTADSSQA